MVKNFRFLAIRPLFGCDSHYLKNLKEGQLYRFYNEYSFFGEDGKRVSADTAVVGVHYSSNIPKEMYYRSSGNELPISISLSAIVGKNGAGKSSLIELFFAVVYYFLVKNELTTPNLESDTKEKIRCGIKERNLEEKIMEQNLEIEKLLMEKVQKKVDGVIIDQTLQSLRKAINLLDSSQIDLIKNKEYQEEIIRRKSWLAKMGNDLHAEIFYEMDGKVISLKVGESCVNGVYEVRNIPVNDQHTEDQLGLDINEKAKDDFLSSNFFYTIALNYSHYGLNSKTTGRWLDSLFHKNDGYKAPIVLNPFRKEGIIDINSEASFAKYRLLTNVITRFKKDGNPEVKVTEKQSVHLIRFKWDGDKQAYLKKNRGNIKLLGDDNGSTFLQALMKVIIGYETKVKTVDRYYEEIENYLVHKFKKIAAKYSEVINETYNFSEKVDSENNQKFINHLKKDKSHITFKIRQALNFLKHYEDDLEKNCFNPIELSFELEVEKLAKWLGDTSVQDIIYNIPPTIFEIDFLLKTGKDDFSPFSYLSSGEQQLIHALQSVNYHINNLQSAHSGTSGRVCYKAVNIIYDEIELYFHPDLQRRFVKELLESFQWLYLNEESPITSINILFLTHSPFILSDIPKEFVLRLGVDEETKKAVPYPNETQTFGGNIHDLFEDSFFVQGTLIGDYAKDLLMGVIDRAKQNVGLPEDVQYIKLIGDSFLRTGIEKFISDKND